jgi:hypothetical protein
MASCTLASASAGFAVGHAPGKIRHGGEIAAAFVMRERADVNGVEEVIQGFDSSSQRQQFNQLS